jgi:hypothetical protein
VVQAGGFFKGLESANYVLVNVMFFFWRSRNSLANLR